jgi:hypothetical protein
MSDDLDIDTNKKERNFGEGIRLLRLFRNKLSDTEDFKVEENAEAEELDSEAQQNSLFLIQDNLDGSDDQAAVDLTNTFKSKKALNNLINDQSVPSAIKSLKYLINILLIILLAIAFADYFLTLNECEV